MTDYSGFKCKFIPKDQIWSIADDFRRKHWPQEELPVDIEKVIESELNMFIIPETNIHEYAKIDAYLRSDFKGIVVDEKQYMDDRDRYKSRLRFSFAHEVGHYVLHQYVYSDLKFDSPKDLFNFIMNVPESEYKDFEWQANEFSGRLLVPRDALISEIKKILVMLKDHSLLDMLQREPDRLLERVSPLLCKPFGVSEEVIEMRVQREGLWPPRI
jgi:Zn-dependent peptidase ImmA (M78 family)